MSMHTRLTTVELSLITEALTHLKLTYSARLKEMRAKRGGHTVKNDVHFSNRIDRCDQLTERLMGEWDAAHGGDQQPPDSFTQ